MACLINCRNVARLIWNKVRLNQNSENMNKINQKSVAVTKIYGSNRNTAENKTTSDSQKFTVLPTPVKSASDRKEYK